MTATNSRVLRSAVKSTPAPGVRVMLASMSACCVLPAARSASTACCWVRPAGICWLTTPSNRMSVALPRIFGPTTANETLTIANRKTMRIRAELGTQRLQQAAERAPEVLGLLGRQPDATERAAHRPGRRASGPGAAAGRHAASSVLSWE